MIFNIVLKYIDDHSIAHFKLGDGGSININLDPSDPADKLRHKMLFDAFCEAEGKLISYEQITQLIETVNNFKFVL